MLFAQFSFPKIFSIDTNFFSSGEKLMEINHLKMLFWACFPFDFLCSGFNFAQIIAAIDIRKKVNN